MKSVRMFFGSFILFNLLSLSSFSAERIWTGENGSVVEAELVKVKGNHVFLKIRDQGVVTVDINSLCADDRKFIETNFPPAMSVEVSLVRDRSNRSKGGGKKGNQIQTETISAKVKVTQKEARLYNVPLSIDLILIGENTKQKVYVVLGARTEKFSFQTKRVFEFSTNELTLEQKETSRSTSEKGMKYEGYLALVRDPQGKVLAIDASRKLYETHADALKDAKQGMKLDQEFNPVKKEKKKKRNNL